MVLVVEVRSSDSDFVRRRRPRSHARQLLRDELSGHLRDQRWRILRLLTGLLGLCGAYAGLLLWLDAPPFWVGMVLGVALAVGPSAVLVGFMNDERRFVRYWGIVVEEDDSRKLLETSPVVWTVQHRVEFHGFDVDHVVTTPAGVLAVETKWMSRWDPSWTAQHRQQALRGARSVRALLRSKGFPGLEVRAVLVVWGPASKDLPDEHVLDGVLVLPGPRAAAGLVQLATGPLDRARADEIDAALRAFIDVRDEYRRRTTVPVQQRRPSPVQPTPVLPDR